MSMIYISYSRDNEDFARWLEGELSAAGCQTWIDVRDIPAGVPWRDAIFDAIATCDDVILCISPTYIESEMCRAECFLARSYKKRIFPLRVEHVTLNRLANHVELKGLEDIYFLLFSELEAVGFSVTREDLLQSLLRTIRHGPTFLANDLVYFAYPYEEAAFATKLAQDISSAGFPRWIPSLDSTPGMNWQQEQWAAMMKARAIVVVLTLQAAASRYIQHQVLFARTRKLPLLPVIAPSMLATPGTLGQLQADLDATYETRLLNEINWFIPDPDYATMLEKLTAHLAR
jgi:hypothetical protein